MRYCALIRGVSSSQGTKGSFYLPNGKVLCSLELPWLNNTSNISCIPSGWYTCRYTFSPRFQRNMYLVYNVTNRSGIRIHPANFAGDISKGYKRDLLGCIALGYKFYGGPPTSSQLRLVSSVAAMQAFEKCLAGEDFRLGIFWGNANV